MAHGAPDYSNVRKEEFVYRVDDMGEMVARMHRGGSLERRGETVYFETFEYGLDAWNNTSIGTNGSVKLTTADAVSKGFACELIGGSAVDLSARLWYRLPLLSMTKVGLECRIRQYANLDRVTIYIDYYDGTNLHTGYFRYFPILETLNIRDSDDNFTAVLTGVAPPTDDSLFGYMKLVIDTSTDKYVRAMYNNNIIDLSDYALYQIADATPQAMVAVVVIHSVSGQNGKAIIDNIIITRNED